MALLVVTPQLNNESNTYVRVHGATSVFADHDCVFIESYEQALQHMAQGEREYVAVVVVTDKPDLQLRDFSAAMVSQHKVPCLVFSDNSEVMVHCKAQDIPHAMPLNGLASGVFESLISSAVEHVKLATSKKELEHRYDTAQQRFQDVADHFADWLWEVDKQMKVVFSSSRRRAVSGAVEGEPFADCFLPEEKHRIEDDFCEFFKEQKPFHDAEYWSFDAYGTRVCWLVSGVPIFDRMGSIVGFRGMARDISAQKSSADQVYHLANNDALTGLYNRNRFNEELGRIIRSHKRNFSEGALILLNINRFRFVNEKHGYDVGDKLIVHVAQSIRDSLRKDDVVARLGADEFAIILSNASEGDAELRARLLLSQIEDKPFEMDESHVNVSACAGISYFPKHGRFGDELVVAAGVALAEAKQKGSGVYITYDDQQLRQSDVSRKLEMLDFVARCLDDEQERVLLYYQPIVSLNAAHDVERYEVLIRLIDDNGDIVSPVKFIEIVEEFGLVTKLDQVVAHRALDCLEGWQKQGRNIGLSINISGRTLEDDRAVDAILDEVKNRPLKPNSIVFELTETTFITDIRKARDTINRFRAEGAAFALDDCGVGYASLSYIRELDLDYIKIDGSFIRDLHRNQDDDAFVKALRDVARQMKVLTVAEMVEEGETVAYLQKLGIDFAQGYHFAAPSPDLADFEIVKNKVTKH